MSKLLITKSKQFDKDIKIAQKRHLNLKLLWQVVERLANREQLEPKYRDHKLQGAYQGFRECHILPNWILIYQIDDSHLQLFLLATGSHSDLFK